MKLLFVALVIAGYLAHCEAAVSEALDVTLVVFSGLPDPQWLIEPKNPSYQKIQGLLKKAKNGATYLPQQMPAQLGYRGFLVRENKQKSASLILGVKTKELQKLLLKTLPPGQLNPGLINSIVKAIDKGEVLPNKGRSKRYAPDYNAATSTLWNEKSVLENNNCYNYANDKITNTRAVPGRASGKTPEIRQDRPATVTKEIVKNHAKADGLRSLQNKPKASDPVPGIPADPDRHLVALVVAPGADFHWYRLDSDGRWSHKPGISGITKKDGLGNQISDPRQAKYKPWAPDYQFVRFMTTDRKTVNIA